MMMDFRNFSLVRDTLYLAFLFSGAAAGCLLIRWKRDTPVRQGGRWVSAAACILSCAVALFAGSVALSGGAVFAAPRLFFPALIFFAAGALSFRFPQAGVCVILFTGVFAVFAGAAFLRHPRLENGEVAGITARAESGGILVRSNSRNGDGFGETWNLAGKSGTLYFEAATVTADKRWPVFGGERRGFFTGAGRDGEPLFSRRNVLSRWPGFQTRLFRTELPVEDLIPGITVSVGFDSEYPGVTK